MLDTSGVALAAIRGLDASVREALERKDREIAALRSEVAELRRLVTALSGSREPPAPAP